MVALIIALLFGARVAPRVPAKKIKKATSNEFGQV